MTAMTLESQPANPIWTLTEVFLKINGKKVSNFSKISTPERWLQKLTSSIFQTRGVDLAKKLWLLMKISLFSSINAKMRRMFRDKFESDKVNQDK